MWNGIKKSGKEDSEAKLLWDFEFNLQKTTTSRRPDLMLQEKQTKIIWICDMACPQENNIEKKRFEKRTSTKKYVWKRWFVWKDRGRNVEDSFDGQWDYNSQSAFRTRPKWLNKFMIITALSKGVTNYLMVPQFIYMIWIGSIAIIL